jgi:hypothetical protein
MRPGKKRRQMRIGNAGGVPGVEIAPPKTGRRSSRAMTNKAESDPHQHVRDMSMHLQETINRLRADIEKVDEPQLKAIFETSAEVLCGLKKAYSDYEQKKESAWPGGRELHS